MATVQEFPQVHVNVGNIATVQQSYNQSDVIDCSGTSICGFVFDSAVSDLDVSFNVANDLSRGLWPLYDTATNIIGIVLPVISVGAKAAIDINPQIFAGWRYVQVQFSTVAIALSQVEFCLRPV